MNKKNIVSFLAIGNMALLASQLAGCSSVNSKELVSMINNNESIEIDVATPENTEQGTEKTIEWTQLDQLQTYKDLRLTFDDTLNIVSFGQNGKNGVVYVDKDGNWAGNSTLYVNGK